MLSTTTAGVTPGVAKGSGPAGTERSFLQRYGLIMGIIGLVVVCLLPTPDGLPVAGKRMLAILLFSVIVWVTDSISYPVSAVVIPR